jgi:hypothetical protein
MGKLAIGEGRPYVDLNVDAQAKALRLRMYVLLLRVCTPNRYAEGNRPRRDVEAVDLIRHAAEEYGPGWKCWTYPRRTLERNRAEAPVQRIRSTKSKRPR